MYVCLRVCGIREEEERNKLAGEEEEIDLLTSVCFLDSLKLRWCKRKQKKTKQKQHKTLETSLSLSLSLRLRRIFARREGTGCGGVGMWHLLCRLASMLVLMGHPSVRRRLRPSLLP